MIAPGSKLAHYEIVSALGKGGMGEVWRARDTKLGREVAIKTLPAEFAQDTDRLDRFEREAKLLASLNHPNIAAVYGLEEHQGARFLVLELVEGDTLADRIARGAIPVEESLKVALQIAEALEAAHDKGVIHRDLKPANIKVTPDDKVKVLDFGLAKAFAGDVGNTSPSKSPTLSVQVTQAGVILGTAAYMSPEQAKGLSADRRADLFSFGCVLFELLTGRMAFRGEVVGEILASVINQEPDYAALQENLHPRIRELLRRCFEKQPKDRWQAAGDVRVEIQQVLSDPVGLQPQVAREVGQSSRLGWIAAIAAASIATWLGSGFLGETESETPSWSVRPIRFSVRPPDGVQIYAGHVVPFDVSPDGRLLVFVGLESDGETRLWLRSLESEEVRAVDGTEGATFSFWSPDSLEIGFSTDTGLYRVPVEGGTRIPITERSAPYSSGGFHRGATWNREGVILAADLNSLYRTAVDRGETPIDLGFGFWPQFLDDGQHYLYAQRATNSNISLGSLDGDEIEVVLEREWDRRSTIRYVAGRMFYVDNNTLWAQPFDQQTLTLSGERQRVLGGIPMSGAGIAPFAVSSNGVVAVWPSPTGFQSVLRWYDRYGNVADALNTPAIYSGFALSRDGSKVAYSKRAEDGSRNIFLSELSCGDEIQRTFEGDSLTPLFSMDGDEYLFSSARGAPPNLHIASTVGLGQGERVLTSDFVQYARSWSREEDLIVYEVLGDEGSDLWVWRGGDEPSQVPLSLNTNFTEAYGRLSPDGNCIAYVYDGSGPNEVWVAEFPTGERGRPVAAGAFPEWRGDGAELFFLSPENELMATPTETSGEGCGFDVPEPLFTVEGVVPVFDQDSNVYAATADGERFLFAVQTESTEAPPISVILNWQALLDDQARSE